MPIEACKSKVVCMTRVAGFALILAVAAIAAGCSGGHLESEVAGTVTLDGKAVGPGIVIFAPVGGKENPATGPIERDGSYSLKTSRTIGLKAGKYQVGVSVRELPVNPKPGDRPPPGKMLIPDKYESSDTSGLEFEVTPGSNTINIELKSK
jgi:hypothetical protein